MAPVAAQAAEVTVSISNFTFTPEVVTVAPGDTVIRIGLPRISPCRPIPCISRSTVQRATSKPSRTICRQTLRAP